MGLQRRQGQIFKEGWQTPTWKFDSVIDSGASHSHTMYVISSAVKHCNSKLTSLLPARNTLQVIKQPYTPSSMVWLLLLLEAAFVCLLIHYEETVQSMQFVPQCCLAIEYMQYKMVYFPQENVKTQQSVQFVDVSSLPECFI